MGIETCTHTIIIGKKKELEHLYEVLEALPSKNVSGRLQKCLRDNQLYNGESSPRDNGYFIMDDVVLGKVSDLTPDFNDAYFLAMDSSGWNCNVETTLFLECNEINYEYLAESLWTDYEPFAEQWRVINKKLGYNETVTLVDDVPDDPRCDVEPSKQILYAQNLMSVYEKKKLILKHNSETEKTLENIQ